MRKTNGKSGSENNTKTQGSSATSAAATGEITVIVNPRTRKPNGPFAHVVALSPNAFHRSVNCTCLHVFAEKDQHFGLPDCEFGFADGVIASAGGGVLGGKSIMWPELHAALSLPVKGFEGIMNVRPNEPPHVRVKILDEDGYAASRPDPSAPAHGILALRLLAKWNAWYDANVTFKARAIELYPKLLKGRPNGVLAAADNIRHFCRTIGLKRGQRIDFTGPWCQLHNALLAAVDDDARVRRGLDFSGTTT